MMKRRTSLLEPVYGRRFVKKMDRMNMRKAKRRSFIIALIVAVIVLVLATLAITHLTLGTSDEFITRTDVFIERME